MAVSQQFTCFERWARRCFVFRQLLKGLSHSVKERLNCRRICTVRQGYIIYVFDKEAFTVVNLHECRKRSPFRKKTTSRQS
jgi:hypothetical protein